MGDTLTISVLAKALAPIAKAALPLARRLHAERKAGQSPFSVSADRDPLNQRFDNALLRLGAIKENLEWWKSLLIEIKADYTRPQLFEVIAVREWLTELPVQADLKALALGRLIGQTDNQEILARLRQTYSDATGETVRSANAAIAVVVSVLLVNAYADLTPGEAMLAGMLRNSASSSEDRDQEHSEKLENILHKVGQLGPEEDPIHGATLKAALNKVLRRRAIPGIDSKEEIIGLIQRIEQGDLDRAPKVERTELYYWAARLLAPKPEDSALTRQYLAAYKKLSDANKEKVEIIESWLEVASGNSESAIEKLSRINTADARSSVLAIISKGQGEASIVEWLDTFQPLETSFFTAVGWRNAAAILSHQGHWGQALELLSDLPSSFTDECPEIGFLAGLLHAGYLLPTSLRQNLLNNHHVDLGIDVQERAAATEHRIQAREWFQRTHKLMLELDAKGRALGCEYWLTWLRLTDTAERAIAAVDLAQAMQEGKRAVMLLDLALRFDVEFDTGPLERYLRRRELEGKMLPQEHAAQLLLLQHTGSPSDILSFLNDEESVLRDVFTADTLASIRVRSLINGKRLADAEKELDRLADAFSKENLERHRLMIADQKGEDLVQLIDLVERTGDYEDLMNLASYLGRTGQWEALLPHARSLLEMHPTAQNLGRVVEAMKKTESSNAETLALIDEYPDLIRITTKDGADLLAQKAWLLFDLGRFGEAQLIVDELIKRHQGSSYISLEINLALRTGQWEHFSAIVDREYPNLAGFSPRLLLQMASVIADIDDDRAMDIAAIACEKAPEDGKIQANAYWLASQIGRESEAGIWLQRMMQLSEKGEGPGQSVSFRELVEMMPARVEEQRTRERQYETGDVPLHAAATLLNTPIAQILVGAAQQNDSEQDARRRSILPIRHGGRVRIDTPEFRRPIMDITSLLILEDLGVLGNIIDSSEGILLSARLMDVLFMEHRQVRFHQPSRVREAERIRKLVADGAIKQLQNVDPPSGLSQEVGKEMASLIEAARVANGRVVASLPIHKAGSLEWEHAELGEFAPLLLKTTQLAQAVENDLDPEISEQAFAYLSAVDQGDAPGPEDSGSGPFFIDNLALHYLDTVGILQAVTRLGRDVFIAPSVAEDARTLTETSEHRNQVAELIEQLRKRIRDAITNEKVTFLPAFHDSDDSDMDAMVRINLLKDILVEVGEGDAVCIDDRSVGKHANVTDRSGKTVPLLGVVDILEALVAQGALTEKKRRRALHRLRKRGFAFLPIDADEVFENLKRSVSTGEDRFSECRELKAVRENTQRIFSLQLLRQPDEVQWINQLMYTAHRLLVLIWQDDTVSLQHARQMADWVLDVMHPAPAEWVHSFVPEPRPELSTPTVNYIAGIIFTGAILNSGIRKTAFADWAEQRLIKLLLPANKPLVDKVSRLLRDRTVELTEEAADEFGP